MCLLQSYEGRKYFIYDYMAKDHSDRERKHAAATTWAILFNYQQGIFYMHHPRYGIAHITAFVIPVVEHWLEREIGPP